MTYKTLFNLLAVLALASLSMAYPAQAQRLLAPGARASWPHHSGPMSFAEGGPGTESAAPAGRASLPFSFIPNAGQTDPAVRFQAHSQSGTLFFTPHEVVFALSTSVLRLGFEGANPAPTVTGDERLPGIVNYFIGDDPAGWRTNLPTYAALVYEQLYPGVTLCYGGTAGLLKGTYTVAPGADPTRIHWRYDGATSVRLDPATGDLRIGLSAPARESASPAPSALEEIIERAPIAWQEMAGRRVFVPVRYVLIHRDDPIHNPVIGFELGDYDPAWPLVIDPTLDYGTYLGGSGGDYGNGVAVDGSGNIYVTGQTASLNFPTHNPYQDTNAGGCCDVFVTKLNAAGSVLLYSTYLGGTDRDIAWAITVDGAGNAYLTGDTSSPDFPTTADRLQNFAGGIAGGGDAFVTKLGPAGDTLAFSTWLGGGYSEYAMGIAIDASGNVYVTGYTGSTSFPVTANAYQSSFGGIPYDAFVTKIALSSTPALAYSTYFGGSNTVGNGFDSGRGIAADSSGLIYVAGQTGSESDFPIKNAYDSSFNGGANDAFIARFDPSQSGAASLLSSTFFGGNNSDYGAGLVLGASNTVYLAGGTTSTDFPLRNAYQSSFGGGDGDAFVARFNSSVTSLLYGSYLGGSGLDVTGGMAVDGSGNAYLTGWTESPTDWPIKNPIQATFGGGAQDAFVAQFDPASAGASSLVYSTYLGGSGDDRGDDVAVNVADAHVVGSTNSADFPLHLPYQGTIAGDYDAFVVRISPKSDLSVTKTDAPDPATVGRPFTYTISLLNNGPEMAQGVRLTDTLPAEVAVARIVPGIGSCTYAQPGRDIYCNLGAMERGEMAMVTVMVTPTVVGTLTNTVEASAANGDADPSNNAVTATTTVGHAAATVGPAAGGVLTYTDGQGNPTTVSASAGAVTDTTTLLYTALPTTTASLPSGFAFAGHAFTLDAYRNGAPLAGFAFQLPVTITLHYSEADVAGLDEDHLTLSYWDGSQWADAATTCTPPSMYDRHPDQNWLTVPVCHLTEFALFGRTWHQIYLPLVIHHF